MICAVGGSSGYPIPFNSAGIPLPRVAAATVSASAPGGEGLRPLPINPLRLSNSLWDRCRCCAASRRIARSNNCKNRVLQVLVSDRHSRSPSGQRPLDAVDTPSAAGAGFELMKSRKIGQQLRHGRACISISRPRWRRSQGSPVPIALLRSLTRIAYPLQTGHEVSAIDRLHLPSRLTSG